MALADHIPRAYRVDRSRPLPRDDVRGACSDAADHARDGVVRLLLLSLIMLLSLIIILIVRVVIVIVILINLLILRCMY